MSDEAVPVARKKALAAGGLLSYVAAFLVLCLFFLLTAPPNHSLSGDAYRFARMITLDGIADVEHPRLFLWIAAMQALYAAASWVVPEPDVFRLIWLVNGIQAASAVTLFARMLVRDLSVDRRSAWLAAGLLASSYGIWRYSTEIEVYASATLLCVLLLVAAFALGRVEPARRQPRVLALAVFGAVATLAYQPIGLLAGIAVPFYLLIRCGGIRQAALYCAVAGPIVLAGFWLASRLAIEAADADAVAFVLDTEAVRPELPGLLTPVKVAYALGHALLSTNWVLAFEPVQEVFARVAPARSYEIAIYAAERAGPTVWAAAATLPLAAVLLGVIVWTAIRRPATARFCAREATLVVWLGAHAAMLILLAPGGSEAWIPALVAVIALFARRAIAPTVAAGRTAAVALLLAVFLVHNAVLGLGVLARTDGDYLRVRGGALLALAKPDDLVVMATNERFEEYLRYAGMTRTMEVSEVGVEKVRQAVDATLAAGGRVLFLDDIASPPPTFVADAPALVPQVEALARDYLGSARRHPLGDTGWVYEVEAYGGP
jgi:hypothetical protein